MENYDQKKIEEEIKEYWKKNDIQSKAEEKNKGKEKYFFIDGPPYMSGPPHVGHMQGKVLKDAVLRFKWMQGYDVWNQAGFDTHGLPIEVATEEEMGVKNKNEIGKSISAKKFIETCKEFATEAEGVWKDVMQELGVWQDFDNPYLTYQKDYIESVWWLFKQVQDQDLLYRAKKPIHWCPRCQTSLSGYEVTDEYKEIEDISIFVKFPLQDREEKIVIWTTTPWTIPANLAVMVHPEFEYARVKVDGEVLIMANQLVGKVMEEAGYEEDEYEIINTLYGSEIQGKKYVHPYLEEIPEQRRMDEDVAVHRIHTSRDLVTLEEGTGAVHIAPGHGVEDYQHTRSLGLPVFSPLDREGVYTEEAGELEGKYTLEANEEIVEQLEDKGYLLHSHMFRHEYPHCWRCKTQLLMRAAKQWFIKNERTKRRMLEENKEVEWIPGNTKERFRKFVEDSPDWCVSRQNYWGTPMPIWICDSCGEREVIGDFEELEEKLGELPDDFDPHKHMVDEMTWDCDCGGTYRRVEDVLDVWFDSGSAPMASLHYPFEEEPFESLWPMDFITEASDQIRGWFYSLLFCGILGFDETPYKKILFQGYVLDADGRKMSKSLGNVVDPVDQLEKFGADLPRYYSLRVAPPWEQTKYDEEEIENEIYRLFSVYWNVKQFFESYEQETGGVKDGDLEVEDRWILSRLNSYVKKAPEMIENGMFHKLTRELEDFIVKDVSRWYVKKIRKRVKRGDRAAISTLREVIMKTNKLLAPFVPHITEKVYLDLEGTKESVHLEDYPKPEEKRIDRDLEEGMEIAREVIENASRIRDENDYNLRWPAKKLIISTEDETKEKLEEMKGLLEEMANVKEVGFGEVTTKMTAKPNYAELGPQFGDKTEEVARLIRELEHEQLEQLKNTGEIEINGYVVEEKHVKIHSETEEGVGEKKFSQGQIYLDLHMTEEIKKEAYTREAIRAIQQKRKEVGLNVEDKVDLAVYGNVEPLRDFEQLFRERIELRNLEFEEREMEYKGELEFEDWKAKFGFSKPVK
ncbi:MAG: isoleucine--tRNA ligase [Candidatus Aenigmatarchaeota archaeon]